MVQQIWSLFTKRRTNTALWLAIAVVFIGSGAPIAWSQSQSINGTIRGHVADPTGAAISGAMVVIKNSGQGFAKTITTGADGNFVLVNLPLGAYTVNIIKSGFQPLSYTDVTLNAGQDEVLNAMLKVGGGTTHVEVTARAPVLTPGSVSVKRTIDEKEVQNLPLTSRNPYNFILFQPGVSGHPNPELGIPRTLNTNGLLDRINYQLDGMVDTESDRYGLRLFPISDSYVKEVQAVSNSFAPEYGWTDGDVYNVISNSGSNELHGMFQWITRSQAATARPILLSANKPKPDLQLQDFSANAGGPVVKNRFFLFGGYEHLTRGQPSPITITAANAAALNLPASQLATPPSKEHATFVDVRGDFVINDRNRLFIRYNYFRNRFPYNSEVGGLYALSSTVDFKDHAQVIGMQLVSTITNNLLNEFRFSWPYRGEKHVAGSETGSGPQIYIPGVAYFGGTTGAGDVFTEKIPNWNDNVSYVHGAHTIKVGFAAEEILDHQTADTYVQYTFPNIGAYEQAADGTNPYSYTTFKSQTDANGVGYRSLFWGLYAQDTWQVNPRFLVVYGLRYDRFQSPNADSNAPFSYSRHFNIPNADFSPRLGFTWQLNDKTVMKMSIGTFYEAPPTNLWYNALNQDGSNRTKSTSISISQPLTGPPPSGAPAYPNSTSQQSPQDVITVSPDIRNEYTWNGTLQFERQVGRNDSVMFGYVIANGRNLMYMRNINLINPVGTLADGRPVFGPQSASTRMDPQFNNISSVASGANSSYNALLFTYQHRLNRGIEVQASYTYSHTITDAPEVDTFEQNLPIEDPTNKKRDRGNSSVNRPQAFLMSAVIDPEFSLDNPIWSHIANNNMLALLFNVSSGDEQNITANRVLNGDSTTASVTRPLFVGRNSVRGPMVDQIDARYTRSFPKLWHRIQPSFIAEANNVFNVHNVTFLNTTVPVNNAGQPVDSKGNVIPLPTKFPARGTVLEARILQFGLSARW